MDAPSRMIIERAIEGRWKMRVGRKLRRTIYLHNPYDEDNWEDDICIGIVDSELLALMICSNWNTNLERKR